MTFSDRLRSISVIDAAAAVVALVAVGGVLWSPKLSNAVARATGAVATLRLLAQAGTECQTCCGPDGRRAVAYLAFRELNRRDLAPTPLSTGCRDGATRSQWSKAARRTIAPVST